MANTAIKIPEAEIFRGFTFSTDIRTAFNLADNERNVVAMPIPEHVTFDKERCISFVDRLRTHYEDGNLKPRLMLFKDNQVLEISSIKFLGESTISAELEFTFSDRKSKKLMISDNTHRLVQFRNHIECDGKQINELCLGWEDRTDKANSGFVHFENSTLRSGK